MSYEKRTVRHLAAFNDRSTPQYKRSFAAECLGALYMAYKLDSRQMKDLFMRDHGLSHNSAEAIIEFGERSHKLVGVS